MLNIRSTNRVVQRLKEYSSFHSITCQSDESAAERSERRSDQLLSQMFPFCFFHDPSQAGTLGASPPAPRLVNKRKVGQMTVTEMWSRRGHTVSEVDMLVRKSLIHSYRFFTEVFSICVVSRHVVAGAHVLIAACYSRRSNVK